MRQDLEDPSLVLIIDDEHGLRTAVSGLLEMADIRCLEFADGESAKTWLAVNHESVSVCLLDSSLGTSNVSGFDLLKYLRSKNSDLPVLFYSGRDENHAKAALEAGATLYVRKPFDPHSLIFMVRTLNRMSKLSKQMAVTWADRDTLQRCIDAMGADVMLLDKDNCVLLVNKRKADSINEEIAKVLGSKCWQYACPHDGPCAGCKMIKDDIANYRPNYVNEIEISGRSLVTQTAPVVDPNGEIRYFVQTATDFTRYKKAIALINNLTRMSVDRDVHEISRFLVDSLRNDLGYARVRMYLQQDDGLRGIASSGMPSGFDLSTFLLDDNDTHAQLAFTAKCPIRLTASQLRKEDIHFVAFEKEGVRYQIQIPAISANRRMALLTVDDKGSNEDLMPEDAALLALIGPAVADALQSARNRAMQTKRIRWYRGFEEVDNAIADARNVDALLATIIDHLVLLLNGSCGVVMRRDAKSLGLRIVAKSKGLNERLIGFEHNGLHGLMHRCLSQKTQVFVTDVLVDPDFIDCYRNLTEASEWKQILYGTNTLLLEPVFIRGEVDAILVVCFSKQTHLPKLDLEFVDDMARRIAITLTKLDETKRIESALLNEVKLKDLALLSTGIAHGIRNPLTTLQSNIDVAIAQLRIEKNDVDSVRRISESTFKEIQSDVLRSIAIVNRILDWAGPKGIEPNEIVPADIVRDLIEIIKPRLDKDGIEIQVTYPESNATIFVAPDAIRTAITDLFWNAVKAMPNGGAIEVAFSVNESSVSISVSDSGIGMTQEQQCRVMTFDPYSPLPEGGTGLGLYLARKAIESSGGKMTLQSEIGRGSTFTITLPRIVKE